MANSQKCALFAWLVSNEGRFTKLPQSSLVTSISQFSPLCRVHVHGWKHPNMSDVVWLLSNQKQDDEEEENSMKNPTDISIFNLIQLDEMETQSFHIFFIDFESFVWSSAVNRCRNGNHILKCGQTENTKKSTTYCTHQLILALNELNRSQYTK